MKDSSNSPAATAVAEYWLQTVLEDRAESAGPPPWLVTDDEPEGDR